LQRAEPATISYLAAKTARVGQREGVSVADILVSYTGSDRDWAFWVAKELTTLGHVPHVHEWKIKGSDDIYGWMEQHLDVADHVLCVISDDYLKALSLRETYPVSGSACR
jgi:hypothetical protein